MGGARPNTGSQPIGSDQVRAPPPCLGIPAGAENPEDKLRCFKPGWAIVCPTGACFLRTTCPIETVSKFHLFVNKRPRIARCSSEQNPTQGGCTQALRRKRHTSIKWVNIPVAVGGLCAKSPPSGWLARSRTAADCKANGSRSHLHHHSAVRLI